MSRETVDIIKPTLASMGTFKYSYYITTLVLLYCLVFYSLELFTFFNALRWLMCVVGSTVITLALIFTFEIARDRR